MDDALIERVEALERAVTDGEHDLSALATEAEALDRLERLDDQQSKLESRVAELEAATEALRGYVGNIRAVNEEVENKADTALAKAESLELTVSQTSDSRDIPDQPRQGGRNPRDDPSHQQTTTQSPSRAKSARECPRTGDRNQPNSMTADGGLQRGGDHTDSHPSANGDGVETRQTHCEACGQSRPTESRPIERRRGETDDGNATSDTGRLDEGDLHGLHQEEPLVSEEENTSALSRFKELL